jgi:glycerol uptake facilitator-like aquaporin
MQVATQVRLVFWSVAATAVLLVLDAVVTAVVQRDLAALHSVLMSPRQLQQVEADYHNNLLVACVGAAVMAALAVVVRRHNPKIRAAIWVVGPLLALALLCGLVGGPEWAVAPTGDEPELLRQEYARAVPDWYLWVHGIAGFCAACLLFFVAAFVTRGDLREYYMEPHGTGDSYRSWIDRTSA